MATTRIQVLVRLKSGVLDVQGKAVEQGIHGALSDQSVSNVRIGKLIELEVALDPEEALQHVKTLCDQVLVNSVMETYEVRVI